MHSPDFSFPFILQIEMSDRGLGAVLSQVVEGEELPILNISQKLSVRETRYSTIKKKCLPIKWEVLTLRYCLLGCPFTLCSDPAPLQWLHRMNDANTPITHWCLALQPFKFEVVHRSQGVGGGGGLVKHQLWTERRWVELVGNISPNLFVFLYFHCFFHSPRARERDRV